MKAFNYSIKILLCIVFLNPTGYEVIAQSVKFQKVLKGYSSTVLGGGNSFDLELHDDGGYVFSGFEKTTPNGVSIRRRVVLGKINFAGEPEWVKTYSTSNNQDRAMAVDITRDKGYILAGYSKDPDLNILFIRTDSLGNLTWSKKMSGPNDEKVEDVHQTMDGGFIASGYTSSGSFGSWDIFLMKLDSSGNVLWTKNFGGTDKDYSYKCLETSDSGYVVVGHTYSFGTSTRSGYAIKTDVNGNVIWSKVYTGSSSDYLEEPIELPNGDLMLAGYTWSFSTVDHDAWFNRTDAMGNIKWSTVLGNPQSNSRESARCVTMTSDGGFVGGGIKGMFKIDSVGDFVWHHQHMHGNDYMAPLTIRETKDKGFIAATTGAKRGLTFVKTDSAGNGCDEQAYNIVKQSVNPTVIDTISADTISFSVTDSVITLTESFAYYAQNICTCDTTQPAFSSTGNCLGDSTYFNNNSSGNIAGFEWQFGDGTSSNMKNPVHLYGAADTFVVKLNTISSGAACPDSTKDTLIIHENPGLSITSVTHESCVGCCDGQATVTATGGSSPYSFQWDDPGNQTGSTASGLCAGVFHITVSDSNGCSAIDSVEISEPTNIFHKQIQDDFAAYPNPTEDQFFISVGKHLQKGNPLMDMKIVDLTGALMYREIKQFKEKQKVNVSGLSPGVYFVILQMGQSSKTHKLIVK